MLDKMTRKFLVLCGCFLIENRKYIAFPPHYYYFKQDDGSQTVVSLDFDKHIYLTLLQRYKELTRERGDDSDDIPYDIDTYITEINTGAIDADYMNTNFKKWLKQLQDGDTKEAIEQTLNELHKSYLQIYFAFRQRQR